MQRKKPTESLRPSRPSTASDQPTQGGFTGISRRQALLLGVAGLAGCSTGGENATAGPSGLPAPGEATTTSESIAATSTTAVQEIVPTEPLLATPPPGLVLFPDALERSTEQWIEAVGRLPSITPPSDCGTPFEEPISMPNSPRTYRNGVHQGIDFVCLERGHTAVAALPGRIVYVNGGYVEAIPGERDMILDSTALLGFTPPWTLAMLYGKLVVIDHGSFDGVGHVVTLYAHLDEVHDLRMGQWVEAGHELGLIGDTGTEAAGTGVEHPRSIHLHWEFLVDQTFLGAGLDLEGTRAVYSALLESR